MASYKIKEVMLEDPLSDNQILKGTHISMIFVILAINMDIGKQSVE